MANVKSFHSKAQLRQWFVKNHNKQNDIWIQLNKKGVEPGSLNQAEVVETLICFGWSFAAIKSIDQWSYKMRAMRRKPNGVWGLNMINAAKKLKKAGLMHKAGWQIFLSRNKKRSEEKLSEFTPKQIKLFKSNKVAWKFFNSQTPSYKRYMTWWVVAAVREETKQQRLEELIRDSGQQRKLARVEAALLKAKKVYPPGQTPVEEGKNIGQVAGAELRSVGIDTLERLQSMGWEEAFHKVCEMYPHRANVNMVTSLIGAVENVHRLKIDAGMKSEGLALVREMKRGL